MLYLFSMYFLVLYGHTVTAAPVAPRSVMSTMCTL